MLKSALEIIQHLKLVDLMN